jgi:hypothetical protein
MRFYRLSEMDGFAFMRFKAATGTQTEDETYDRLPA